MGNKHMTGALGLISNIRNGHVKYNEVSLYTHQTASNNTSDNTKCCKECSVTRIHLVYTLENSLTLCCKVQDTDTL